MIKFDAAALTDPGMQREINEDRVWAAVYNPSEGDAVGLFIVCDGMGGYMGGECASHWATERIKRDLAVYFCPRDPRETVELSEENVSSTPSEETKPRSAEISKIENHIKLAIQEANNVVYKYAQQKPDKARNAGTTVTMALLQGNKAIIANVGDSRTYLIRSNHLHQITSDHSIVASLVANGQIKPNEIHTHPQRNVIYRALGQKEGVEIDTFTETLYSGDVVFLCSDGLWEMLPDNRTIVQLIVSSGDPAEACRKLVNAANSAGGDDNISVIVINIIEDHLPPTKRAC